MGYRESLAAHDIAFDAALVARGGFNEQKARVATMTILGSGTQIDVIVGGDDKSAIGAMAALRDVGLRVPEDVAVVEFDDIAVARHLTPSLTTVRAPSELVGHEAVKRLVSLIRTGQGGAADTAAN